MHKHQHNQRTAAARAFMESLDQLQNILAQEPQTVESEYHSSGVHPGSYQSDLKLLEEAAADLDEFFGEQESIEE